MLQNVLFPSKCAFFFRGLLFSCIYEKRLVQGVIAEMCRFCCECPDIGSGDQIFDKVLRHYWRKPGV